MLLCWCSGESVTSITPCEIRFAPEKQRNVDSESNDFLVCSNGSYEYLRRGYRSKEKVEKFNQKKSSVRFRKSER